MLKVLWTSNTGEYKGLRVVDARDEIIKLLIDLKKGDILFEFAERPVICRCGTKCVVKILDDQWFLKYSDETLEGSNLPVSRGYENNTRRSKGQLQVLYWMAAGLGMFKKNWTWNQTTME